MRVRLTHIIKVGKKKKTIVYHYGSRQTVAKIYKWHWNEKLDKYGNSMVIKKFSEQPEEEKRPKVSNKAIGLAIAGTTAGAAIGNKVAKNVRLGAAQKKTAAALDKSTLASHLKNHHPPSPSETGGQPADGGSEYPPCERGPGHPPGSRLPTRRHSPKG